MIDREIGNGIVFNPLPKSEVFSSKNPKSTTTISGWNIRRVIQETMSTPKNSQEEKRW